MDPRSSAQDIHRCDLCETAIVHSYCEFCHVNLCKVCIGDHISDGYYKHTIVPFHERRSTLIYPKCGIHSNKHCELHCKVCRSFVCSSCMASEQHIGHRFVEVKYEFETKKEIIKKDKIELGNSISPKYEETAFELENQLANLDEGYDKLTTEISKQGEEWHREIDIVINKMQTEINEIKLKHESILKKHLNEIKQMQSLIKETLIVLEELEKSTEISTAIEYISKINTFSKLPPRVNVLLPTFIPKPIDHEHLYNFFGQIIPLCNAIQENVLSIIQPNTSVRELLDKPDLVATIQTGHNALRSVTCLNEEIFWTSGGLGGIKCFDVKGNLLRTIKTNFRRRSSDIAVDSDGDLLYSDRGTKTVYKKNEQTEMLIKLQRWEPCNLCATCTGDLLVTMCSVDYTQSKVVRYSGSVEKQTIQFDEEGKPLYSGNGSIKYITENRNHDICVADWGAGALVVVNEAGELKWEYTGHRSTTNLKNKPFEPYGITTDSQSRILTADGDNHCIHILDQNGQFLRYIDNCDLKDPFGLCVYNKDNLFVCDYAKGNIRKIKYSKDT